ALPILLSEERRESLREAYASELGETVVSARELGSSGPLQPLVDIVPDNFFSAASSNSNMLQIIFFSILFGVAMILTKSEKIAAVKAFFDGTNLVILRIVDIIMQFAPVGVFALLASLNIDSELMMALGTYSLNVILGLAAMVFLVYPSILKLFTRMRAVTFYKGILPAQMMAFSTSSSAATLPVTMDCAETNLGVAE